MEELARAYADWLGREIIVYENKVEPHELILPCQDWYGDCFQVYVRKLEDGRYRMSDDGYFVSMLRLHGLDKPEYEGRFARIWRSFDMRFEGDAVTATVTKETFVEELHRWVQGFLMFNGVLIGCVR